MAQNRSQPSLNPSKKEVLISEASLTIKYSMRLLLISPSP
jgi:hypothetical protein